MRRLGGSARSVLSILVCSPGVACVPKVVTTPMVQPAQVAEVTAESALLTIDQAVEQLGREIAGGVPSRTKLRLAVLDLQNLTGATPILGRYLAERLTTYLSASHAQYSVIERRRLGQALDELEFGQSDLVDPTNARRFGRMTNVDAIVVGTVSPMSGRVDIDARVVELETTTVLGAARVSVRANADVREMLSLLPDTRTASRASKQADSVERKSDSIGTVPTPRVLAEWSDRSLRVQGTGITRDGPDVRLSLLLTNREPESWRVGFVCGSIERTWWGGVTYLVDDLGNRYAAFRASVCKSDNAGQNIIPGGVPGVGVELPPNVPVRVELAFGPLIGGPRSLTLVFGNNWLGWSGKVYGVTLGPMVLAGDPKR